MKCLICGNQKLSVIDSRMSPGNKVRRVRECPNCLSRYRTYETIHFASLDTYIKDRILDEQSKSM